MGNTSGTTIASSRLVLVSMCLGISMDPSLFYELHFLGFFSPYPPVNLASTLQFWFSCLVTQEYSIKLPHGLLWLVDFVLPVVALFMLMWLYDFV